MSPVLAIIRPAFLKPTGRCGASATIEYGSSVTARRQIVIGPVQVFGLVQRTLYGESDLQLRYDGDDHGNNATYLWGDNPYGRSVSETNTTSYTTPQRINGF